MKIIFCNVIIHFYIRHIANRKIDPMLLREIIRDRTTPLRTKKVARRTSSSSSNKEGCSFLAIVSIDW